MFVFAFSSIGLRLGVPSYAVCNSLDQTLATVD